MARVVKTGHAQGRISIALRQFSSGETIFREVPVVVAPGILSTATCCHCLATKQPEQELPQLWCAHCGVEETGWCSEACQAKHARHHELECEALHEILGILFDVPAVSLYTALLVLRLVVLRQLESGDAAAQVIHSSLAS
jgi:hypothetical protein